MNKEHEYRGYKFNIKVELNQRVEKHPDGKREHKITMNDMGPSNYYKIAMCESCRLESTIKFMIKEADEWIDKVIDGKKSEEELLLESMGFK